MHGGDDAGMIRMREGGREGGGTGAALHTQTHSMLWRPSVRALRLTHACAARAC